MVRPRPCLAQSVISSSDADMTIECLACPHSQIAYCGVTERTGLALSLSPINYLFFPPCLRRLEQFLRQKEEKLKNGCRNWGFLCDGKPTQRSSTRNLVLIRSKRETLSSEEINFTTTETHW